MSHYPFHGDDFFKIDNIYSLLNLMVIISSIKVERGLTHSLSCGQSMIEDTIYFKAASTTPLLHDELVASKFQINTKGGYHES